MRKETQRANNRRRVLVGLAALGLPSSAFAQTSPRVYRVGFLVPRSVANFVDRTEAFSAGMRAFGYVEGKNLIIEWRSADGKYERLPEMAKQLLQSKIDVLVVDSTPGVKAAQAATTTVPIVMISVGDPVASGFVASLSRPGGNITGLSNVVADVSSKYVEILRLAIPALSHIAVLSNPDNSTHPGIVRQLQTTAVSVGAKVSPISARTPADIDAAFEAIRKQGAGALIVLGDPFFGQQGKQIADAALRGRVPTLATNRSLAQAGGLVSYGQNLAEHYRSAATYVDKILKGAKPGDLPVEQSTKIELVLNMKTARALGLTIAQPLLLRADDVIQ